MDSTEKSITWIVVAAALLVVFMGWGFLAGSYVGAHAPSIVDMDESELHDLKVRHRHQASRSSIITFVMTSIEQLPNLPAVISWHLSNRLWLPILIVLALAGVIGGGFVLKKVDQNLNRPPVSRR